MLTFDLFWSILDLFFNSISMSCLGLKLICFYINSILIPYAMINYILIVYILSVVNDQIENVISI